jgi:hypothetical protein
MNLIFLKRLHARIYSVEFSKNPPGLTEMTSKSKMPLTTARFFVKLITAWNCYMKILSIEFSRNWRRNVEIMGRIHFKHSMNYCVHCKDFLKTHNVLTRVHMDFQYRVLPKSIKKYSMEITDRKLLAPAIQHEFS